MSTKEEISAKIKQGREALQMSQREFAKKIGISVALLSFWENGYKDIKPRHEPYLSKMAEYFKCDWRSLLPDPPKLPVFDTPKEQDQKNTETAKDIGKKIKQGREALQLSQREFAKKIGLSASNVCFLENGERVLKPRDEKILRKIAELFKCDWRALLPTPTNMPSFDSKQEDLQPVKKDIESKENENKNLEEMKDPAMLTPLAKLLKAKVYVEVVQEKAASGSVVKIRNKLTGDIAFRYLTSEMGCKLLKPIDKDYEVFPYEENGKFEILGVVNSVVVKKD